MIDRSDLPQGTLDLMILQVATLGPIHGYALAQQMRRISGGVVQVPQGSLYPALHRLENRKLLAADWRETETGRNAKFYRITPRGRVQLKAQTQNWARLSEAMRLFFAIAEGDAS